MTDRLYYRDSKLIEFEATIQEVVEQDGQFRVRLDRSAFYPTSGGQLFDRGTLNGAAVIDVQESDDGEVWHISDTAIGSGGERVVGSVEPKRRLKNRQQHTAQHILSALFIKHFAFETASVHLGEEYGSVELATANVEPEQLLTVETAANQVIKADFPVEIIFAEGDEVAKLPLRKMPDRTGPLRVIRISDLDCSACGGTHCQSTAEVQLIKLIAVEKVRGRVLVKFLSGEQAIQDYALRFKVTDSLSRLFTCAVRDLSTVISAQVDENKAFRKEINALQKELLPIRASAIASNFETYGALKLAVFDPGAMDPAIAGQLASLVAESMGGIALTIADGRLILAVSPASGLRAGELAKQLGPKCDLRGGGSDKIAQLGGAQPSRMNDYKQTLLALIGHA